jgi:hypothetical protein
VPRVPHRSPVPGRRGRTRRPAAPAPRELISPPDGPGAPPPVLRRATRHPDASPHPRHPAPGDETETSPDCPGLVATHCVSSPLSATAAPPVLVRGGGKRPWFTNR